MKLVKRAAKDVYGVARFGDFQVTVGDEEEIKNNPYRLSTIPDYIWPDGKTSRILHFIENPYQDALLLSGDPGCGKSSIIMNMAAHHNIPLVMQSAYEEIEFKELLVTVILVDGSTISMPGPMVIAMENGYWYLLDEIGLLPPETTAALNLIVEYGRVIIPEEGGRVVVAKPGFRFFATDNTNLGGDITGNFTSRKRQDVSFTDRFRIIEMEYPQAKAEAAWLTKSVEKLDAALATAYVEVAGRVRGVYSGTSKNTKDNKVSIEQTFSMRRLLRWARICNEVGGLPAKVFNGLKPYQYALDEAGWLMADESTRLAVHEIAADVIGS